MLPRSSRRALLTAPLLAASALAAQPQNPDPRPCEKQAEYRQFDFWAGEWEVTTADGAFAGKNRIDAIAGGCALLETWASARGPFVGSSLNYFDPTARRWVQVWSDSSGGVITIRGGLVDGAMRLEGELVSRQGQAKPFRGTWTPLPDARVRQHFEESSDGGKTWTTWFDGYYKRLPRS
jgi:hypothetical protein